MGGGGNKGQADAGSINFGGHIGTLPLPPTIRQSDYLRPSYSANPAKVPKEHIARITALLNTAAEAMAVAAMEQKRRLRERKTKMKL